MKIELRQQFNQELNVLERRGGHLTQLGDSMITIYGQDDCVYCKKAAKLCNEEGYIHRSVDINNDILDKIEYLMGFKPKTVPQIFVNEQYVGGFTQFREWHTNRSQENAMIDEGGPIDELFEI